MENFFEKGYHIGSIYDILNDSEIEQLKEIKNKVIEQSKDDNNISGRYDHSGGNYESNRVTIDELKQRDIEVFDNDYTIYQRWREIEGIYDQTIQEEINRLTFKLLNHLYSEYEFEESDLNLGGPFTLYVEGDMQNPHRDGNGGNILCAVLIYLSNPEDWKEENGGMLYIRNKGEDKMAIEPVFGNYVVLDMLKNDVEHGVSHVNGDFKRYASIHFPSVYETSQKYKKFIENKVIIKK
jgi:Rps23 Pro-64 3,4-dihydroxylase Tpa1-like proline 4-hydroxylase